MPPLKRLPSETFFEHCMTGFEGDEAPPPRFPEFYGDILVWSSDVYHHDGDDAWRAIETMQKYDLPVDDQAKFLGGNARRLYRIDPPKKIIRDRVTEIERPDWWPTEEEVKAALAADASVTRLVTTRSADRPRIMTTHLPGASPCSTAIPMSSSRPSSGRNISIPNSACSASRRCGATTARRTPISRSMARSSATR